MTFYESVESNVIWAVVHTGTSNSTVIRPLWGGLKVAEGRLVLTVLVIQ